MEITVLPFHILLIYLSKPGSLMILTDLRKIFPIISIINKRILSIKSTISNRRKLQVQPNAHRVLSNVINNQGRFLDSVKHQ